MLNHKKQVQQNRGESQDARQTSHSSIKAGTSGPQIQSVHHEETQYYVMQKDGPFHYIVPRFSQLYSTDRPPRALINV